MKAIKTVIIGCGARSAGHAQAALAGSGLEIVYACDVDATRAEQRAKEWDAAPCSDYRDALRDASVEAALIVTNVETHIPIAREALAAGKHVIIEKPLGDDLRAARELVALGETSGRVAYLSYQVRFSKSRIRLKQAAERIDPVQIFSEHQRGMMKPQFLNPAPFCGVMDVCAHDFDQILWIMGRAPVAVTASLRRNTFTPATHAADVLSALIEFGDGRSALVFSSIGAREIGGRFDIVGACGNISSNGGAKSNGVLFARYDSGGAKVPIDLNVEGNDFNDLDLQKAFVEEIRTGTRSHAARLADGLNSLLITVGCLRSAQEGRRVALGELE
ncbi:MAG: Gfo/Idh/MocA family oxidoreductase [Kiritimatiellae bacterium]|nr:Gfo/Idh/MocA family oxidoreductase [Kiritimatiellia bacterium]